MSDECAEDKPRRRRMGRPATLEVARRNRVVTLVTDAEFEELTSIAEAENHSVSLMVHEILKNHLAQRR
jgi:hypothetical protein